MMIDINFLFALLVIYKFKHFIADYPLQGKYMLGKFQGGTAWILPLSAHCAVQAFFTFLIGLMVNPRLAVVGATIDFILHFIMDRIKASPNLMGRWKNFSANEYGFLRMGFLPPSTNDILETKREATIGGTIKVLVLKVREASSKQIEKTFKNNTYFWWALGIDQCFHGLTDLLVLYIFLRF